MKLRKHILTRLKSIAADATSDVEVVYDNSTNGTLVNRPSGTITSRNHVAYFESTNILVKIEGSRPDLEAVLVCDM